MSQKEEALAHLTKNRVHTPQRRKPSRFDHLPTIDQSTPIDSIDAEARMRTELECISDNNRDLESKQKFPQPDNENPVMV